MLGCMVNVPVVRLFKKLRKLGILNIVNFQIDMGHSIFCRKYMQIVNSIQILEA